MSPGGHQAGHEPSVCPGSKEGHSMWAECAQAEPGDAGKGLFLST